LKSASAGSIRGIAKELNVSRATLYRIAGWKHAGARTISRAKFAEVELLLAKGHSARDAAILVGLNPSTADAIAAGKHRWCRERVGRKAGRQSGKLDTGPNRLRL
jgi:transposase